MPAIERIIDHLGAKRNLPTVTTTYGVFQQQGFPVLDIEILVPLDRKVAVPVGFSWKDHFLLTNAVMVQHVGDPINMDRSLAELKNYITCNNLTPISNYYNSTVVESKSPADIDKFTVNIYVSISPNIL